MKKKLFVSIVIIILCGGSLIAQSDSFFTYSNINDTRNESWGEMPLLPSAHGLDVSVQSEAPLGSGLLILSGLACLWLKSKNNK